MSRWDRLLLHRPAGGGYGKSHGKPTEKNMPLNITATYKDITDSTDITRLVLMTVMTQVRIPELGIKVDDLQKQLGGVEGLTGTVLNTAYADLV